MKTTALPGTPGPLSILLTLVLLATLAASPLPAAAQDVYLTAARAVDGTGRPIPRPVIRVRGGRIVSVATGASVPPGVRHIDLGPHTLLPGLIDTHVHITDHFDGADERRSATALHGARAARALLMSGFTTVRTLGSPDFADVDLRNAISEGLLPGPRLLVSGEGMSDANLAAAEGDRVRRGERPAPESEVRDFVRSRSEAQVDWLKIFATRSSRQGGTPTYSLDQLRWAVEEATLAGLPVSAHAHAAEGARRAIEAGARTIEHGALLDDAVLELMVARGTYYAPNLYLSEYYLEHGERFGFSDEALRWTRRLLPARTEVFRKAVEKGVPIVFSTDANSGWVWSGETALEFERRHAAGQSLDDALVSATTRAAEALMLSDSVGDLRAGMVADIIAVAGDPLRNPRAFGRVVFVMKNGEIHRAPDRP